MKRSAILIRCIAFGSGLLRNALPQQTATLVYRCLYVLAFLNFALCFVRCIFYNSFGNRRLQSGSLRSWREWVTARNVLQRSRKLPRFAREGIFASGVAAREFNLTPPHSSRDLRGFLHSRSGLKFARVPTTAGYAG